MTKSKLKITNFQKKDSFFFHIENFLAFIQKERNQNYLKPDSKEINIMESLIKEKNNEIDENSKNKGKAIKIMPHYLLALERYEKSESKITKYKTQLKEIIEILKNNNIKINLANVQRKYYDIYKKKYSLMTFSRILRNHMGLKFLKTTVKNPKIKKNIYQFMFHFFLKGISRAFKLEMKLIYIDESSFKLSNNNYYQWRSENEIILGGAENELKKQMNMILGIDEEKIVHYKLINDTINSDIFCRFLEEMISKIGKHDMKNYLIIMDNAKCHISKKTKKFCLKNNLKIMTNIPYYSMFNGIEYVFLNIKKKLYKLLLKNRKELKNSILEIIQDESIKETIKKIYLYELKLYLENIIERKDEDVEAIFKMIEKKK